MSNLDSKKKDEAKLLKQQKLAAALRENLQRRKVTSKKTDK
jgi:hypothetical protein